MRMTLSYAVPRRRRLGTSRPNEINARIWTCLSWLLPALLVLTPFASIYSPQPVSAHHTNIKLPFAAGPTWTVMQGYNTTPTEGGSHYNCDPATLTDAPTHTESCSAYYQYRYSMDLVRADGNTSGQTVLSPVDGTIRWIDPAYGGMSIDLGDGYAFAYFHTVVASGLAAGQTIHQGQYMGTVAPPGGGGNGGTPHIHVTIWQTTDGGNWSRTAIPFTDDHMLDGYDFPALASSTHNQYRGRTLVSSNQASGGTTVPSAPTLASPANGTSYANAGVAPTLKWSAVSGASQYQVVINDGAIKSGWISGTQWTTSALSAGQYAWQVQAKNSAGAGPLSAKWVIWVSTNNLTPTPTPPTAGPPSGTPKITLNSYTGGVGKTVTVSGSGFNASEQVGVYWESTSSTALKTVAAASNGNWSTTVNIPESLGGNHLVATKGLTSGKKASRTFTVTPTLARTPTQGSPGTSIAVAVQGFGASEQVKLTFNSATGPTLGTATTNSKGTGSVNIKIPDATSGWHDYTGVGLISGLRGWGAIQVLPVAKVSPTGGNPSATVTVTAKGLAGSSSANAAWNKTASSAGSQVCTATTTSVGNFSCTFKIPSTGAGTYPLVVTAADTSASTTVGVLGATSVASIPSSAGIGTDLSIVAGGFSANENVSLSWDSSSIVWKTVKADGNGAFLLSTTVPQLTTTAHTLKARGVTSGKNVTTTLTVTTAAPSSMIAPGVFLITGTREGLVGGTTSNGHKIVPNDHFVSLPGCTALSCPWLTPGSTNGGGQYVANCGSNCYVKVTNPTTGRCSVAPVYDRGPWFLNDNWWDIISRRNLNNLPTTKNILAQGYTGADAALNHLDVGYGFGPRGIGISDKGYEVGNASSIDLGDGTWADIGFHPDLGITKIQVTILWLTGENHTTAAAACNGGTSDPAKISLSSYDGFVGSNITVSGSGFNAGEQVNFYFDSSSSTVRGSVTANSSGKFSATIKAPYVVGGKHLVVAKGVSTGRKASRSYTVHPSLGREPSSAAIGATIAVTVRGFGASESVQVRWDTSSGKLLRTVHTNSLGTGTGTFAIPSGVCQGLHDMVATGLTSRLQAKRTVNVNSGSTCTTASVSPQSIAPGKKIRINAAGYGANERVQIFWDNRTTSSSSGAANAYGVASFLVTVPALPGGAHTIKVKGATTGRSKTLSFTVVQGITISPTSGVGGTPIIVTGKGWTPGQTVHFYWNRTSTSSGSRLCSKTVGASGSVTCTINAKNGTVGHNYPIVLLSGTKTATAFFKLTGLSSGEVIASPSPSATPSVTPSPTETSSPEASPDASPVAGEPVDISPSPTETVEAPPTDTATAEPTEAPTETPTVEPTQTPSPEPTPRELVFNPIADTSVAVPLEGTPQPVEAVTYLSIGGAQQAVTYLSFDVEGVAPGEVIQAQLILTGAASGSGGTLLVVPGAVVDEASWTHDTVPVSGLPAAIQADGSPAVVNWLDPGVETAVDVTGTVSADGIVTFAIAGTPDQVAAIASRESGTPPRLVVEVIDS